MQGKVKFWRVQALLIGAMLLALFPLLWWLKFPPRLEAGQMARLYFVVTGLQSGLPLCAFYLIQKPQFFRPAFASRRHIGLLLTLAIFLCWLAGGRLKLFLALLGPATVTLCIYQKISRRKMGAADRRRVLALALPVVYLFLGLVIAFSHGMIASSVRDYSRFDSMFLAADRFLLFGHSVAEFSRAALSMRGAGHALEAIYYELFPVVGGTLLWLGLEGDNEDARNLVCDILTCYMITLTVYWIAPSIGPFWFSPSPAPLESMEYQRLSAPFLDTIHSHHEMFSVGAGYFIAFPCMHLAQSTIVAWHMRRWPRLFVALVVFNVVLVLAILGLQWHYFIDLLGGLVLAFAAVRIRLAIEAQGRVRVAIKCALGELP